MMNTISSLYILSVIHINFYAILMNIHYFNLLFEWCRISSYFITLPWIITSYILRIVSYILINYHVYNTDWTLKKKWYMNTNLDWSLSLKMHTLPCKLNFFTLKGWLLQKSLLVMKYENAYITSKLNFFNLTCWLLQKWSSPGCLFSLIRGFFSNSKEGRNEKEITISFPSSPFIRLVCWLS